MNGCEKLSRTNVLPNGALRASWVAPAPEGLPDLDDHRLFPASAGETNEIQVLFDADAGSLAFCVGGQTSTAITAFKGMCVCPCVQLQSGEAITVCSYFT